MDDLWSVDELVLGFDDRAVYVVEPPRRGGDASGRFTNGCRLAYR